MGWITRYGYQDQIMNDHDTCECERCHRRGDHDELYKWHQECPNCEKEWNESAHENGEHENPLLFYRMCRFCEKDLKQAAAHTAFEFAFTVEDVKRADEWARAGKFSYDNVNHLLHDAMAAGVIQPRTWKAA